MEVSDCLGNLKLSKATVGQILIALAVFLVMSGPLAYGADVEKYESKPAVLDILERLSWKGDFRLRTQIDKRDQAGVNTLDRSRLRIRFRLGSTIHLYEDLDIGFRLVTGKVGDATSSNETLDGGFGSKSFNLDRAFFKWSPRPFTLEGGKFKVPFMKSELIWDSDVNVEGVSERFSHKSGNTYFELILGQFIIDEINTGGDDIKLFAYQGVLRQQTGFGKFDVALAYYDYADHEEPSEVTKGVSNNTLSEVKVVNLMGQWSGAAYGKPLSIFGEYAQNTGALAPGQPDLDTAWQAGFAYGKSGQKFADWDIRFIYKVVQTEAVLDALADSDFHGGLNNARGFEAMAAMGLRKGVKLALSYFKTQEESGPEDERETFKLDLKFKF